MNEATMLARVQAHLDARCDPLDDAEVVAFLDTHPESLAVVAALCADAHALAAIPALPLAARRRRWPAALAAAALLAAAGVLVAVQRGPVADAHSGRIVEARLEEIRPRTHAAAAVLVVEPLAHFATARFETWQLWSELR